MSTPVIHLLGRVALGAALCLGGCATTPPAVPAPPAPEASPTGFVDTVWKVRASNAVQPGTLYVFLSEGTLVIASTQGTPSLGRWEYRDGALTMVEESIPYRVDILGLTRSEFRIRSHNPGEPVEMTLVPAHAEPPPRGP